jgi:RND family efflux transporter MFP subunit
MTVTENNMKAAEMNFSKKIETTSNIPVFFVILFVLAALAGCSGAKEKPETIRPVIKGVIISEIKTSEIDRVHETSGTVKPDTLINVSSRLMGAITSIKVKEGDAVKQGQLIATIDDSDIKQRFKAAEMALEASSSNRSLADVTFRRYAGMYSEKAITAQEMDQVENQKKMADSEYFRARAMLMEARTFLGYTRITSPITGYVTKKIADEGSMASPGMPFMVIESNDTFIEASVDESLAGKIDNNTPVEVLTTGSTFKAHIKRIIPSVDPVTRTFIIKITPDSVRMMSGQFVKVKLMLGKRQAITVPDDAFVKKGALTGVYTVNPEGVISFRIVKTGAKTPSGIDVISGLSSGERIIIKGAGLAVDGAVVDKGTVK